jgi:hypothetical protein
MSFLSDMKFWSLMLSGVQICFMVYGFLILKFNDLSHLEKDVRLIQSTLKDLTGMVNQIDKATAVQNQRIDDLEKSIN